ncbi:MAG: hypothetical protein Q9195_003984 [Heterodermia aff. obscurata]
MARHIWDVPTCFFDGNYVKKGIYFPALLMATGNFLAKASIFLLFQQIFTVLKPMRIAIWIGLAVNLMIFCPSVVVATYYQTPRSGETWVSVIEDDRQRIAVRWWQAQSALSAILDMYTFILPLPAIFELNLSTRKRISIITVFSLALM